MGSRYEEKVQVYIKLKHEEAYLMLFRRMSIWRENTKGKRRNKSHYCPKCNRGFTLKKNMNRHLRHECGMAPKYQCPYCCKLSKFSQNIYSHIRKYHPDFSFLNEEIIDDLKHLFVNCVFFFFFFFLFC
ncbi:zinc finger and BTB domain-containing protein 6-like [Vespa crabro]|uniref:zinc finger and BTB domain-containing protein 6-like n=1 Tax=Vespa crabro TaxID=7445 RepID=UPI001F01F62E|nr:zinc finger and BTB domain-containing protein 6-like [Vespa crabro]